MIDEEFQNKSEKIQQEKEYKENILIGFLLTFLFFSSFVGPIYLFFIYSFYLNN